MPFAPDPLTNIAGAFIKLLRANTLLKALPWAEWDSAIDKPMPRGYLNVTFDAGTVEAGGPITSTVEIVVEGKPKRQKMSAFMGELFGVVTDPSLHIKLNGYANGVLKFYRQAERLHISQRIEGDVHVRRTQFEIQVLPLA